MSKSIVLTHGEWKDKGIARYGADLGSWKYRCPVCGHVATPADWRKAGAPEGAIAFSCIGRWTGVARDALGGKGDGPCNYAGGGLFQLNPIRLKLVEDGKESEFAIFDFADSILRGIPEAGEMQGPVPTTP